MRTFAHYATMHELARWKAHLEPSGLLKSLQTFIGREANGNSGGWETPGTGPIWG